MFKYILSSASTGINWMALFALITFFTVFIIAVFQIFFQRKEYTKYMADLPLDDATKKTKSQSGIIQKIGSVVMFMFISMTYSMAQGSGKSMSTTSAKLDWIYQNLIALLAAVVILIVIIFLFRMLNLMVFQLNKQYSPQEIQEQESHSLEAAKGLEPTKSFWQSLTNARPISEENSIDLGHDYDGIRELDNSLPPWWLYMFYGCIIFGGIYMWYYHWSDRDANQLTEYVAQMREGEFQKAANLEKMAGAINENNVTLIADASRINDGKVVFNSLCAACHLQNGGGSVGPNLTDAYWIHGGGIQDIYKTIKYGVPEKGMISWQSQIRPADIQNVSSYILSLQGTNPPGGKAPQGDLFKGDSTSTTIMVKDSLGTSN